MPGKIILTITKGPLAGREMTFTEHDTIVFGRGNNCKALFPEKDPTVSRHHFLLEVIPPTANLRDLGSLNGTYVNNVKTGGREKGETPEEGGRRDYPVVDLKDGDEIRIGESYMTVRIVKPVICVACGEEIPDEALESALQDDGSYLCSNCRRKKAERIQEKPRPIKIVCLNCGKDVTEEAGPYVTGGYLCLECRRLAQEQVVDPMEILQAMLKEARLEQDLEIPDYEVIKRLGKGGMGAVYLVRNKANGEKSALKIMLPKAELVVRSVVYFRREIDLMKKLDHPNIIKYYDACKVGGITYYVMEFCEGGSAADLAEDNGGRLSLDTTGRIMLQALEGLAYAHQKGIVHRDLKPQNILLTSRDPGGVAKIADLGLAKDYTQAGNSGITGKEYAGTMPFMPREQVSDFLHFQPVSDVWAMGATMYNMLTDRFPREFTKDKDHLTCILQNRIIPIEEVLPSIPRHVAEVLALSLSDDVKARYQTASEFKQALAKVL